MKVEKRNGGYRVQPQRNGVRYSLTFDHKPTKKDIEDALLDIREQENKKKGIGITFGEACRLYNDNKSNVLSASTIAGYESILKNISPWFLELKLDDIKQSDIDKQINEFSAVNSPKTVANRHGYIASVIKAYRSDIEIKTTLPQKVKNKPYIPKDNEIKTLIDAIKGSKYEVAIWLAIYGLRRSEICAITGDDIDGDVLRIEKAMVKDKNGEWITQNRTKTKASYRYITIPQHIADKIKEDGYAFNGCPDRIGKYLSETLEKNGMKHFSLHKLRHYFASKLSAMHVPDADILAMGGWETDKVMKEIYRDSLQTDEQRKEMSKRFEKELFS